MILTLAEARFVEAFKAFVRREGCSPSLGDLERALGHSVTVGRVRDLRNQLVRKGMLTYVRGEARSMRLVAAVENLSDAEVLHRHAIFAEELEKRGLAAGAAAAAASIRSAVDGGPYTNLAGENAPEMSELLRRLDGESHEAGQGQSDDAGADGASSGADEAA